MLIQALQPLIVQFPDRQVTLKAGSLAELKDEEARTLVRQAQGKVRALVQGAWIKWRSPLFSPDPCGQVAMLPENGWIVVRRHSVTGNLALVEVKWIIEILPAEPDQQPSTQSVFNASAPSQGPP